MLIIAIAAFALIAVTWIGYPAVMWLLARRRPDATESSSPPTESVCVVVATRDDPAATVARVRNLRASDYPAHQLRVVIAVDRMAAHTLAEYGAAVGNDATIVAGDAAGGKAANLNAGVRAAGGAEVIVFADVGQEFDRSAIRRMVETLRDPSLGGVAGRYTQRRDDSVMAAYAGFEAVIRRGQASRHSVVSTSGSIYAIRAASWRELPPGLICDDLYTTLSIVRQGRRVAFRDDAVARDPRAFTRDQQFARRVRTLTGLIQYATLQPWVLVPWGNPIWIHFMMHKVMRLLTPIPLALGGVALLLWAVRHAPLLVGMTVAGIVVVAVAGLLVAPRATRAAGERLWWVLRLQLVPVFAITNGLRRRWTVWTPTPQGRGDHAGAGA